VRTARRATGDDSGQSIEIEIATCSNFAYSNYRVWLGFEAYSIIVQAVTDFSGGNPMEQMPYMTHLLVGLVALGVLTFVIGLAIILIQIGVVYFKSPPEGRPDWPGLLEKYPVFTVALLVMVLGMVVIYGGLRVGGYIVTPWDCPKQSTTKQTDTTPTGKSTATGK
jgi:hypothetical protein